MDGAHGLEPRQQSAIARQRDDVGAHQGGFRRTVNVTNDHRGPQSRREARIHCATLSNDDGPAVADEQAEALQVRGRGV